MSAKLVKRRCEQTDSRISSELNHGGCPRFNSFTPFTADMSVEQVQSASMQAMDRETSTAQVGQRPNLGNVLIADTECGYAESMHHKIYCAEN